MEGGVPSPSMKRDTPSLSLSHHLSVTELERVAFNGRLTDGEHCELRLKAGEVGAI